MSWLRVVAPLTLCSIGLAGCTAATTETNDETSEDLQTAVLQPTGVALTCTIDQVSAALTAKYGAHPHAFWKDYPSAANPAVDVGGTAVNDAQRQFFTVLPEVTAFMNTRLAKNGVASRVTEAELATNFFTEGGVVALRNNQTVLDGFQDLGIDQFIAQLSQLKPYVTDELLALSKDPQHRATATNEKGEPLVTLTALSVSQSVYANAAMYVLAKVAAATDLAKTAGPRSDQERFFWSTIYYNAGFGAGRRFLTNYGVEYARRKWTSADDFGQYSLNARYNATWRTATFEAITQLSYTCAKRKN